MWPRPRAWRRDPADFVSPPPTAPETDRTGIDFGWRAHEAVQGWTASVDVKASIVVVVEIAGAGAATQALITGTGELHHAIGLHLASAIIAVTLLVLSVVCALWVVFPRLASSRTSLPSTKSLIYFGHLRDRGVDDIAQALTELTPEQERRQLASQLHITGAVAWRKHSWLQRSLVLFALGAVLLVVAYTAF